jgi:hypothetical protein
MKVVEQQSRQIADQNRTIQELTTRVQALEAKQAPGVAATKAGEAVPAGDLAAVKEDLAAVKKKVDSKLSLSRHIEGLKITGDLRLRHEFRNRQRDVANPDNDDRQRSAMRLRLGLLWNSPAEHWEIGAGLATGGADGRSANDTWGDDHLFEKGDIRLDYAYARHAWLLDGTRLALTFGQHENPFVMSVLNWDADARPTGITAQYGEPLKKTYSGPFATAGAYDLYNGDRTGNPAANENSDVMLFAGQVGYKLVTAPADYLLALGYSRVTANFDDVRDADPNTPGFQAPADTSTPGLWHADQQEEFDVVDLLLKARTRVGGVDWEPYGHVAYNFGADGPKSQQNLRRGYDPKAKPESPEDNALAWLLGLDATYGKLKLGYAYVYVEADSVFGPLRDNEPGSTTGVTDTDVWGHKLTATWGFTPNFTLGVNAYFMERLDGGSGKVGGADYDKGSTYQLEAIYRF